MSITISVTEPYSFAQLEPLRERLYEFNEAATRISDSRLFAVFAHDASGTVGLAEGFTWGKVCKVLTVWIEERHRGAGHGRRMMEAVVEEATRRGCRQILLTTHSFQAPGFYEKLGFERLFQIEDFPEGHTELHYRRRLSPEPHAPAPR